MAYNVEAILNTIRANGSAEYTSRVPVATQTNLSTIGQVIMSYTPVMNEFLNQLVNRIALVIINNKTIENPLRALKKGGMPLGNDIESIFVNPANGETYNQSSTDLLTVKNADVKSIFYRLNRQDKFSVTITQNQIARAFTSNQEMSNLIDSIVSSLYSGDNYQEFILMKNLLATAVNKDHITKVNIFTDTQAINDYDESTSKQLVKQIKTYSKMFTFPSSNYNKYSTVKGGGATPVITWTPQEDQVLILNALISANIDIDVLAYAFNLDKTQIQAQTIDVDDFGGEPVLGILTDKSFFQVYDNLLRTDNFYNPDTISFKYYLHHWQTYGYNLFCNAVAFTYTPLP